MQKENLWEVWHWSNINIKTFKCPVKVNMKRRSQTHFTSFIVSEAWKSRACGEGTWSKYLFKLKRFKRLFLFYWNESCTMRPGTSSESKASSGFMLTLEHQNEYCTQEMWYVQNKTQCFGSGSWKHNYKTEILFFSFQLIYLIRMHLYNSFISQTRRYFL